MTHMMWATSYNSNFKTFRIFIGVVRISVRALTSYGTWYKFWYAKIRTGTDFISVQFVVRSKFRNIEKKRCNILKILSQIVKQMSFSIDFDWI